MKYVLIIGAKNELALELASLYAKNNYNIYLAGRSVNDLEEESNNIEQKYKVKSVLCELDVTDFSSHEKFYESLEIKPTGVIYLAGYYPDIISSTSKWSESWPITRNKALKKIQLRWAADKVRVLDLNPVRRPL